MPTASPRNNPYKAGDIVHLVDKFNASGEGVLWRVTFVRGGNVWITPVLTLTLTGASKLHSKKLNHLEVVFPDLVALCNVRANLDNIINDIVRARSEES